MMQPSNFRWATLQNYPLVGAARSIYCEFLTGVLRDELYKHGGSFLVYLTPDWMPSHPYWVLDREDDCIE